jgi:hypothetical protein
VIEYGGSLDSPDSSQQLRWQHYEYSTIVFTLIIVWDLESKNPLILIFGVRAMIFDDIMIFVIFGVRAIFRLLVNDI